MQILQRKILFQESISYADIFIRHFFNKLTILTKLYVFPTCYQKITCVPLYMAISLSLGKGDKNVNKVMVKMRLYGCTKMLISPYPEILLRNQKLVEVESSRKMELCKTEEKSPPPQRILCSSLKNLFLDVLVLAISIHQCTAQKSFARTGSNCLSFLYFPLLI